MLTAVRGHYNGSHIVPDEALNLIEGQEVIITILNPVSSISVSDHKIDLRKYMGRGKKMMERDAQEYIKGLRNNDRL